MADPDSCPTYDESDDHSYVQRHHDTKMSPRKVAEIEVDRVDMEVEGIGDFAERTLDELRRIGVEARMAEGEPEIKMPERPKRYCSACGSNQWWLRDNEWVCDVCHPKPTVEEAPEWF